MTSQHGTLRRRAALARALPRAGACVLGLTLMASDGSVLGVVGIMVFVPSVLTNPRRWWHYVLTGEQARLEPAAEYAEPGSWAVELRDSGARQIEVLKAVREVSSAAFLEVKNRVQNPPARIATGLSEESARRVRDRVEVAGADAVLVNEL